MVPTFEPVFDGAEEDVFSAEVRSVGSSRINVRVNGSDRSKLTEIGVGSQESSSEASAASKEIDDGVDSAHGVATPSRPWREEDRVMCIFDRPPTVMRNCVPHSLPHTAVMSRYL